MLAFLYGCGLLYSQKRNIERMTEIVPDTQYSQIQHFISESPWSYRSVFDEVSTQATSIFNEIKKETNEKIGLLIDETGIKKKGEKSVGVARQYCGNLGKVENSQCLVVGALSAENYYTPVDEELFLPEVWSKDLLRSSKAGVPKKRQELGHQTKPELALEIIKRQRDLGVPFDYVAGDALYGNDTEFLKNIDELGIVFMMDVHKNQTIYLEKPRFEAPEIKENQRGRKPTKNKLIGEGQRVDEFCKQLKDADFELLKIRKGSKGWVKSECFQQKIFTINKKTEEVFERILLIRRTPKKEGGYDYKYALSNAKEGQFTLLELAKMQAQRYFVERTFQEFKQDIGMHEYQVRGWLALHHHLSLCVLIQLYILKEKRLFKDKIPELSAYDLRQIMIVTHATKHTENPDIVFNQMYERHQKRAYDKARYYQNE